MTAPAPWIVLVTGLSGSGKNAILRALEDLGFHAVDNPPLAMLDAIAAQGSQIGGQVGGGKLAMCVDARSAGFDAAALLAAADRLRAIPGARFDLVFATADDRTLQRRFTETRRRHPLAPQGRVGDGIAVERAATQAVADAADATIDTSDLPLPALRQAIEARFGGGADGMSVCLTSFAFPRGLPADADMVFDARFLRNPHYDPALRPLTGLDPAVAADVARDPDHDAFLAAIAAVADLALPRFAAEGKKYATVAIGCTGGRHRSVHLVERLAAHLSGGADARGWRLLVTHRELAREGTHMPTAPEPRT